jgi:hypothetical protein
MILLYMLEVQVSDHPQKDEFRGVFSTPELAVQHAPTDKPYGVRMVYLDKQPLEAVYWKSPLKSTKILGHPTALRLGMPVKLTAQGLETIKQAYRNSYASWPAHLKVPMASDEGVITKADLLNDGLFECKFKRIGCSLLVNGGMVEEIL